jgi:hypothetical protein
MLNLVVNGEIKLRVGGWGANCPNEVAESKTKKAEIKKTFIFSMFPAILLLAVTVKFCLYGL